MSMLAERRTKKKWCLNPNGKDWSNDDNKFGQRLLEKMGWKKGCGLGVNLQGMKDHVRVSAKNDTKGLGCKNNSDAEWIHHQQNFENLLSELASSTNEEITLPGTSETKPVSLEEKSKKSRVRVHYQKFTRGKDVARYSANDLACIFGKKSFEMQYSCHVNTRNLSEAGSEVEDTVEQSLNLCKEKSTGDCLPSLLPKHRVEDQPVFYSHEDKGVKEKQTDILKEISNVKENSVADLDIFEECKSEMKDNSASHHSSESLEKIRSKRKRKHVKDSEISNVKENSVELDIFEECKSEMKDNSASHHSSDSLERIRSKRKRKHVKDSEISNVKENSVEDLDIVEECKSEMKDNSASDHPSESLEKIRSKRKRKHVKDSEISNVKENSVEDLDIIEECKSEMKDNSATHHSSESSEKIKSKKKRKRVNNSENTQEVFTDTIILNSEEEVNECDTVAHEVEEEEEKKKRKKKKKDKKKKVKVDETGKEVNEILIEELIEVISDSEETGNKDLDNAGESNEADTGGSEMEKIGELYQTNILEAHEECPEMKKRKRKKKKNPCSQSLNEPEVVEDITSEIVSPLPPDNEARVNNVQKSTSYASEQFSSNKNESHPDHSNRAGKHWKTVQKLQRTSMDFGFKGSNLHSISGYGRLRLSRADVLVK